MDIETAEIDFKALSETLQHENERLRLLIVKLRNEPKVLFDQEKFKQFIAKNYMVISAVSLIIFVALGVVDTFTKIRKK